MTYDEYTECAMAQTEEDNNMETILDKKLPGLVILKSALDTKKNFIEVERQF